MISGVSTYIWAIVVTWIGAHVIKYIVALLKGKQLNFKRQIFVSGGMPSAHVATTGALSMVVLLIDGPSSTVFAISVLLTLIVAHDALRVRRSSGEQGEAITKIIEETGSKARKPLIAKGHTPSEVFIGVLFGVTSGFIVFLATT